MAEPQTQTSEAGAAGSAKHMIVLVLDNNCKMVGFEFRKYRSNRWEIGARRNLTGLSVTVGGTDEGPYGQHAKYEKGIEEHPGPHGDADQSRNNVHDDVKKGGQKKRAHMTFSATGNDPCCQCGDELVCYD